MQTTSVPGFIDLNRAFADPGSYKFATAQFPFADTRCAHSILSHNSVERGGGERRKEGRRLCSMLL